MPLLWHYNPCSANRIMERLIRRGNFARRPALPRADQPSSRSTARDLAKGRNLGIRSTMTGSKSGGADAARRPGEDAKASVLRGRPVGRISIFSATLRVGATSPCRRPSMAAPTGHEATHDHRYRQRQSAEPLDHRTRGHAQNLLQRRALLRPDRSTKSASHAIPSSAR